MANARSETVASKPSFRGAFKRRRCLVVADGFYEWQKVGTKKHPHFIRLKNDRPFGIAGLWERWDKQGEPIESCTLLTTEPNDLMKPIHDRMPVIIPAEKYSAWLDPKCDDQERLLELLRPYPDKEMLAYPISTLVNKPQNDVPKCIEPVQAET
jgi:putative SOS response-associated peptidase YedK